jgi:ABC-type glycerol-3-phosphate transport system substrate-binding protein
VPVAVQGLVWYINKTILTKVGLDPESPPKTWEDFLRACAIVKAGGYAPIACGEKEGDWADWFLNSSHFLEMSAEDATRLQSGGMRWDDPKVIALFNRFKELARKGYFQEGFISTPLFPDTGEVFMRGEAAFCIGLLSDVAHWKEFGDILGAENLGVMPCPGTEKFPVGGGFAYGVTSWSPAPELAFDYIKLIVSDENANEFLKQAGSFPANQSFDAGLITDPNAKTLAGWIAEGRSAPPLTGQMPTPVVEAIKREGQRILSGQTTVPGAAAAIQAAADQARAQ